MKIINYMYADEQTRRTWIENFSMDVGLRYFGGKAFIGKYIMNHIFNLASYMKVQRHNTDIFIDAFTGGGKIGLSMPEGWFDTIVINDIDYGVYCYYEQCKENPDELVKLICAIGDNMSRELFHSIAYMRKKEYCKDNKLMAAALTYWVTMCARDGMTDPDKVGYHLTKHEEGSNKDDKLVEHEEIMHLKELAKKRIPKLSQKLNNGHYIIENLGYKELIKKYNGKKYIDLDGDEQDAILEYTTKDKLWYLDPPYFAPTLFDGNPAPYGHTFTEEDTHEMTEILHGDNVDTYGSIDYFIKSDYDPKEKLGESNQFYHEFDMLEEYPFCKVLLGEFSKGAMDDKFVKSKGKEYIWCKGFPEEYSKIEG